VKTPSPSPQKVIQNIRDTLSTLEKRETHLEKRIKSLETEARFFVKTNKLKALMLLKKAKMNGKQLTSIYGQRNNLEMQIFALEQGINNQNTVLSLKQGKNVLETMSKELDPDDLGELIDDIAVNLDMVDEITTALSTPIGQAYDEDDLLAEFEEKEKELVERSILSDLPVVPTTKLKSVKTEMDELMAMM
jgi:charged multivesicular body protein 4